MIRRTLWCMAAAICAVSGGACGETPAPPQAASTPPQTAGQAASPTPAVTLVSQADLRAAVPDIRGWTRGEIVVRENTGPDNSVFVVVPFTRGTEKLELEIADTGGAARAIESLEHIAGSSTNRTVGNGYFKGTTIGGFPAVESWNTVDKIGELSVLIRRRFIIHVAGSGLANAAAMRSLAEAVDASRLR